MARHVTPKKKGNYCPTVWTELDAIIIIMADCDTLEEYIAYERRKRVATCQEAYTNAMSYFSFQTPFEATAETAAKLRAEYQEEAAKAQKRLSDMSCAIGAFERATRPIEIPRHVAAKFRNQKKKAKLAPK